MPNKKWQKGSGGGGAPKAPSIYFFEPIKLEKQPDGNFRTTVTLKAYVDQYPKANESLQIMLEGKIIETVNTDTNGIAVCTINDIPPEPSHQTISVLCRNSKFSKAIQIPSAASLTQQKARKYALFFVRGDSTLSTNRKTRNVHFALFLTNEGQPVVDTQVRIFKGEEEINKDNPLRTDINGMVSFHLTVPINTLSFGLRAFAEVEGQRVETSQIATFKPYKKPQVAKLRVESDPIEDEPGAYHAIIRAIDENGEPVKGVPIYWHGGASKRFETATEPTNEHGVTMVKLTCSKEGKYSEFDFLAPGGTATARLRLKGEKKKEGIEPVKDGDTLKEAFEKYFKVFSGRGKFLKENGQNNIKLERDIKAVPSAFIVAVADRLLNFLFGGVRRVVIAVCILVIVVLAYSLISNSFFSVSYFLKHPVAVKSDTKLFKSRNAVEKTLYQFWDGNQDETDEQVITGPDKVETKKVAVFVGPLPVYYSSKTDIHQNPQTAETKPKAFGWFTKRLIAFAVVAIFLVIFVLVTFKDGIIYFTGRAAEGIEGTYLKVFVEKTSDVVKIKRKSWFRRWIEKVFKLEEEAPKQVIETTVPVGLVQPATVAYGGVTAAPPSPAASETELKIPGKPGGFWQKWGHTLVTVFLLGEEFFERIVKKR